MTRGPDARPCLHWDGPIAMAPRDKAVHLVLTRDGVKWATPSPYRWDGKQWRSVTSGFPCPSTCDIVGFHHPLLPTVSTPDGIE